MDLEERLNILEMNVQCIVRYIYSMQQATMGFSLPSPPPRLPFEREPSAPANPCNHHLLPAPTPTAPPVPSSGGVPAGRGGFQPSPLSSHLHFGLDPQLRAHWADVYSRLVRAGKLRSDQVTSANFTYLMCGEGTPALGPIRWYGSTRELAYMVRRHLNSKWEVALASFKDKNDNPLPKTLKNTKAPSVQNMEKIDRIFRTKD